MKKIFEQVDFDPNRVVEIQKKVKDLLRAPRQRREEIKQEIAKEGAGALPGLINSTYVWMNEFETDKPMQLLVAGMMASAAKDNDDAHRLIFQAGILENPFPAPRTIAIDALEKIHWKPNNDDIVKTKEKIKSAQKIHDDLALLDLYSVVMMAGEKNDMKEILSKCCEWIETTKAGELLPRLIKAFPNEIEAIITEICADLRRKGGDKYKNKSIAKAIVGSLRPIPAEWVANGTLTKITIAVAKQGNPPRHTVIEYLWQDAVADFHNANLEKWHSSLEAMESSINTSGISTKDERVSKTLYRYWFRAIGSLKDSPSHARIYHAATHEQKGNIFEDWAIEAACQLFFMQKNPETKGYLQEIEEKYPERYEMAEEQYERINSGPGKTNGAVYDSGQDDGGFE